MKRFSIFLFFILYFTCNCYSEQEKVSFIFNVTAFNYKVGTFTVEMKNNRLDSLLAIRIGNIIYMTQWLYIDYDTKREGIKKEEAKTYLNKKIQVCTVERDEDTVTISWQPSNNKKIYKVNPNEPFYTFNSFLKYHYENKVEEKKVYKVLLDPTMLYLTKSNISATNYHLRSTDNRVNIEAFVKPQPDGTLYPVSINLSRFIYLGLNWNILKLDIVQ